MINQLIYRKWVLGLGGQPHTLRIRISTGAGCEPASPGLDQQLRVLGMNERQDVDLEDRQLLSFLLVPPSLPPFLPFFLLSTLSQGPVRRQKSAELCEWRPFHPKN